MQGKLRASQLSTAVRDDQGLANPDGSSRRDVLITAPEHTSMKNKTLTHPIALSLALLVLVALVGLALYRHRSFTPSAVARQTRSATPAPLPVVTAASAGSAVNDAQTKARLSETFGKLPLCFVENRGQLDSHVAYYVQGSDKTLYFTPQGITFALASTEDKPSATKARKHAPELLPATFKPEAKQESTTQRWVVKLDFVGANPNVQIKAHDQTEAVISYFKGPREQWNAGLKTYATLVYEDLWPGIDLVYSGTANRLKYHFLVKSAYSGGNHL